MTDPFVNAFREAAPYIHYLRGKTLVVGIASHLLDSGSLNALSADFHLLAALGIRLVLVHGCDTQIARFCPQNQRNHAIYPQRRIIDDNALQFAKHFCGAIQFDFQAALSLGVARSPQRPPRLRLIHGNFLSAKPLGVHGGVDMQWAGQVRKVDAAAIEDALAMQAIVLISPIAASLGGQSHVLSMPEVAAELAIALQAEKLVFLTQENGIRHANGQLLANLTAQETHHLLSEKHFSISEQAILTSALHALQQGISRVQILSGSQNGGLLRELFTRHGAGTSIAQDSFMNVRPAHERDIADIITLIKPLEERGILLPRSPEYLAAHIHEFFALEHDRQIYGCVAMKTFSDSPNDAELACLVVSPDARDGGFGELLLEKVLQHARQMGKQRLFALSTHTADWFLERGFQAASAADLPAQRLAEYQSNGRQSKIFILNLNT
ncbi:amino-acid N-acetyltransferase [Alysiella filiformis]|uniref:Amino-acid acetyltransferase n=1 Tax=Alysiella filiformis DSM 16848 TaxID=1120981 RepID=A0A286EJ44_9NEIS|nr:amino-acid N-acetyltransferase [Alysiella filiformis]QMT30721.1 amino-acid N-acetyltransferase [Alysiella filiformis]UBQ56300.1 amino-acid N-acetyltransferase [Alysiella filiformis DSM 16848]SOD70951.1 N-acetylglutamate synthase [Alysiella filiformis DSM 16848]